MAEPKKPQDRKSKQTNTVTVQGITVTVPPERFKGYFIAKGIAKMQDDRTPDGEKLVHAFRVLEHVLRDDLARVEDELVKKYGDELEYEQVQGFLNDVMGALNPNS